MNYGKTILKRIREERQSLPEVGQKDKFYLLQHNEGELQFQVKFKDVDKYGIVVDYISIAKSEPILDVNLINKKLEQQAEKIQTIITYLLEDFALIEMDKMNKRAQLRSYPPHTKENSKFYYEIVLDEGTKVHFQRYEYSKTRKRYEKITSQLTLEIFERLINDLADLLK